MPSPFPGMDPYLEAPPYWPDVHQSLITYIRDALQPAILPRYNARIGERIYLLDAERQYYYGDVTLVERPPMASASSVALAEAPETATADAPFRLISHHTQEREPYLEIIYSASGEVVTVIELLSPANKTSGRGMELYLHKQDDLLHSHANLVEIDLLSQGERVVAAYRYDQGPLPPFRYLVSVSRARQRATIDVFPIGLQSRLPRFGIPLRPPDPDVLLDLPRIFDRCYENGGYAYILDYAQPPAAPLNADEERWRREWVAARRKTTD